MAKKGKKAENRVGSDVILLPSSYLNNPKGQKSKSSLPILLFSTIYTNMLYVNDIVLYIDL